MLSCQPNKSWVSRNPGIRSPTDDQSVTSTVVRRSQATYISGVSISTFALTFASDGGKNGAGNCTPSPISIPIFSYEPQSIDEDEVDSSGNSSDENDAWSLKRGVLTIKC